MQIKIADKVLKYLKKLEKGDFKSAIKIQSFINNNLFNAKNPTLLPNCKDVENAIDNRWRWRLGKYRIIGVIEKENEIKILSIIEIDKKDNTTYSHTKGK